MPARVRAQLLRLGTQGVVWAFAALLIAAATWTGHWSPKILDLSVLRGHPELRVSVAGAVEVASTQIATGLGVALAAVFSAAGPGRDFVDGSAEIHRASGRPIERFASRVLTVTLLSISCGVVIAFAYIIVGLQISAQDDFALNIQLGSWNPPRMFAGIILSAVHATWVLALAQWLRTQASQVALPVAAVIAMFLISRLSPYPMTPDSWLGPILGLRADRAMLDFWWSVGGDVSAPWGNVALLLVVLGIATAFGIRSDKRVQAGGLGTVGVDESARRN